MTFQSVTIDDARAYARRLMSDQRAKAISDCKRALSDQPAHIRIPLSQQLARLRRAVNQMRPEAAQLARNLAMSVDFIEAASRRSIGPVATDLRALCGSFGAFRLLTNSDLSRRSAGDIARASNDDGKLRQTPAA